MAIKTVTLTLNNQTHTIPLTTNGTYIKQISAPDTTSFTQPDHTYAMVINIQDTAGNITTVDKNHAK